MVELKSLPNPGRKTRAGNMSPSVVTSRCNNTGSVLIVRRIPM
jgi:hypothetical protein